MWPHREPIMTPKFQWGATCTKVPDREMLACESTTPCCNPLRRQADCRKADVCGVSSKQSFFFFFWRFSWRLLLPFHMLCLVSLISERQMFNFWTLVNILQIKLKSRYPLFSRNCHETQHLTSIVQSRFPYLLFSFWDMPPWILNSARRKQLQYNLFHFLALSGGFRHLKRLSNTFRHAVMQPAPIDQDDSCWLVRMQWLFSVWYNTYRRFKQFNIVF